MEAVKQQTSECPLKRQQKDGKVKDTDSKHTLYFVKASFWPLIKLFMEFSFRLPWFMLWSSCLYAYLSLNHSVKHQHRVRITRGKPQRD
jgi:hypothetical protein